MNLASKAMSFAMEVHANQVRKYTGNPYADHLAEVAGVVAAVTHWDQIDPEVLVATAWLHDSMEDQGVTTHQLNQVFKGESLSAIDHVMRGVILLSDFEQGSRDERKAASRIRLGNAPHWVQTIKCADIISNASNASNASSVARHDPVFAVTYLEEKRLMLDVLAKADHRLRRIAYQRAGGQTISAKPASASHTEQES